MRSTSFCQCSFAISLSHQTSTLSLGLCKTLLLGNFSLGKTLLTNDFCICRTFLLCNISHSLAFLANLFSGSVGSNLQRASFTLCDFNTCVSLDLASLCLGIGSNQFLFLGSLRASHANFLFLNGGKICLFLTDNLNATLLFRDFLLTNGFLQFAGNSRIGLSTVGFSLKLCHFEVIVALLCSNSQSGVQLALRGVTLSVSLLFADITIDIGALVFGGQTLVLHVQSCDIVVVVVVVGNVLNIQGYELHTHIFHFVLHGFAHCLGELCFVTQHILWSHRSNDVTNSAGQRQLDVLNDALGATFLKGHNCLLEVFGVIDIRANLRRPIGDDGNGCNSADFVAVSLNGEHAQVEILRLAENGDDKATARDLDDGLLTTGDD